MKINNINSNKNFGMAQMSKSVQRFISQAQKECKPEQKPLFDMSVNLLKTLFSEAILTKTANRFHLIAKKENAKGNNIGLYNHLKSLSHIRGDKVGDVCAAASALDFVKLTRGGAVSIKLADGSSYPSMPLLNGCECDAFIKKWGDFHNSSYFNLPEKITNIEKISK